MPGKHAHQPPPHTQHVHRGRQPSGQPHRPAPGAGPFLSFPNGVFFQKYPDLAYLSNWPSFSRQSLHTAHACRRDCPRRTACKSLCQVSRNLAACSGSNGTW